MGQDTVLIGGLGFLLAAGVAWFLLEKLQKSKLPLRTKRLGTYALVGGLIAVAIVVIEWHSANYKRNHETSALPFIERIIG